MSRLLSVLALTSMLGVTFGDAPVEATSPAGAIDCSVTPYAAEGLGDAFTTTWYGGEDFWAGLDMSYQGRWYAEPGFMKVQWRLPAGETLAVEGRRLDESVPPLRVEITHGYDAGFQPTALTFPTEGCWEVVGRIPGQELRFVVFVHPGQENPSVTRTPIPEQGVWERLRRPLVLPSVETGGACPTTTRRHISRVEDLVLGDGPVYAQGFSSDGKLHLGNTPTGEGTFLASLRWIVSPDYPSGPLLVRGRQLDGDGGLQFRFSGSRSEVRLVGTDVSTPDWWVWQLKDFQLSGSGCYAIQVDGQDFSDVIVFEAVPGPNPVATQVPRP